MRLRNLTLHTMNYSVIPRLFPPPVFDYLQYANIEGEGREIWSHVVTSGRQRVDTQG